MELSYSDEISLVRYKLPLQEIKNVNDLKDGEFFGDLKYYAFKN